MNCIDMQTHFNEYDELLKQFVLHTIPNNYIILKFVKGCGYSEILILPKYANIRDLLQLSMVQFGEWIRNTMYYTNNENEKIYIHTLSEDMLIRDLLRNLKWAYSINDCIHNVHMLYYGDCKCVCNCEYEGGIECCECGNYV